jgi:SpoVK/Ycf46/Vps4 family AAA+-type ATPase
MATSEQIKALIKSHIENDEMRFATTALQIAAHEARQGHIGVAEEIKSLVDKSKTKVVKLRPLSNDLNGLFLEVAPADRLGNLIVSDQTKHRIERILLEYLQKDKLRKHGHTPRRKILLAGPPGTGKTMTAGIFAKSYNFPISLFKLINWSPNSWAKQVLKLRLVFEWINERKGVYLFDEFDAIGTERAVEGDVGEMRRVLNSFLQMLEQDRSESVIVAATNNLQLLDQALFRRFDDVIHIGCQQRPKLLI